MGLLLGTYKTPKTRNYFFFLEINMTDGLTASDVLALERGNGYGYGGFGDGSWSWVIIILLFLMGGGGFWGSRQGNAATLEDVNNVSNFSRLENQVRSNENLIQGSFADLNKGICELGYEMSNRFAQTNERILTSTAEIKDLIYQDKIEALKGKVSALELQQALCGVVRYPTAATYSVATPFTAGYSTGCCSGSTINI